MRLPICPLSQEFPAATFAARERGEESSRSEAATSRSKMTGTRIVGGLRAPKRSTARRTAVFSHRTRPLRGRRMHVPPLPYWAMRLTSPSSATGPVERPVRVQRYAPAKPLELTMRHRDGSVKCEPLRIDDARVRCAYQALELERLFDLLAAVALGDRRIVEFRGDAPADRLRDPGKAGIRIGRDEVRHARPLGVRHLRKPLAVKSDVESVALRPSRNTRKKRLFPSTLRVGRRRLSRASA